MTRKLIVLVVAVFVLAAAALVLAGTTVGADERARSAGLRAGCQNPGFYTGTDDNGVFQDALEDAIAAAETCAGCCDQRVSYEVLQTRGERGGFVFINDIEVTIEASW
jgi:hypothetical protein